MQDNSEIERPPKPTWGNEPTMPSELNELNENDFIIVESQDVSGILSCYKNKSQIFHHNFNQIIYIIDSTTSVLSPTEEYLHMTKRLIEKGSLSPRTSMILKELYTTYELNDGYGLATFDSKHVKRDKPFIQRDSIEIIKSPIKREKRKERIKEEEYVSREPSISRRSTIVTIEEEEPLFGLHVVKDTTFERPCDPEAIKINNIFSDFSLIDTGYDKSIKKRITQWIKERKEQGTSEKTKKSLWRNVRLNEEHYFIEIFDFNFCFLFLDIKKKMIK